jgi:hypothetical protein
VLKVDATALELLLVGGCRPSWKNNGAEDDEV